MLAKVRRWGNGLALRVHKRDLESAGVAEGDVVQVELIRSPERGLLDVRSLPPFAHKDKQASPRGDASAAPTPWSSRGAANGVQRRWRSTKQSFVASRDPDVTDRQRS